jgi:hypothetical protein
MKYDFTELQIIKIQDALDKLDGCDPIKGDCKVEKLKLFKDKEHNFYYSYLSIIYGAAPKNEFYYIKIDREGVETILNYTDATKEELEALFGTFEQITM